MDVIILLLVKPDIKPYMTLPYMNRPDDIFAEHDTN